jgi:hypothetical protein
MTQLEIYKRQLELAEILLENSKDEEMKKNAQELYNLCKSSVERWERLGNKRG